MHMWKIIEKLLQRLEDEEDIRDADAAHEHYEKEVRTDFSYKPNRETLEAHEEALKGGGVDCKSLEDFWKQMGVKPIVDNAEER